MALPIIAVRVRASNSDGDIDIDLQPSGYLFHTHILHGWDKLGLKGRRLNITISVLRGQNCDNISRVADLNSDEHGWSEGADIEEHTLQGQIHYDD